MLQQIREYKILEKVGEGGMGVVYKGYDSNLDRYVAIKAIHNTFTSNHELVARFKQEAKVQAGLVHPNIVSLHNFFQEEDCYYMVMEFVEGETLAQKIKRTGLIPPHKCIPMFLQMLEALDYAHKKGVVHRDVKPSNIIIDKENNVKVMDFGIAKILGEKGMTQTGSKLGTIYYMSPEQINGDKDIDRRSDIFSLGITFFEMLTGKLPYDIDTNSDFKLMQKIVENNLPSVKDYYPYVPDKVDLAISKATRKERSERFQNCKELVDFIKKEEISEEESKKILLHKAEASQQVHQTIHTPNYTYHANQQGNFVLNRFPKAQPGKRLGAYILDSLVLSLPWGIFIAIVISLTNNSTYDEYYGYSRRAPNTGGIIGTFFLIGIPLLIFSLIKDGFREGKGICKGALGLRIISEKDGRIITKGKGFGRTILTILLYCIPYVNIVLIIVDIVKVISNPKGQKIVDSMLGLQVVEEKDIIVDTIGNVTPRLNNLHP